MNPQPNVDPERLTSKLKGWLQIWRLGSIGDDLVAEYVKTLSECSEAELSLALEKGKRESPNYAPTPGRLLEIVQNERERHGTGVLEQMAKWGRPTEEERKGWMASPEWQALKEKVAKKKPVAVATK